MQSWVYTACQLEKSRPGLSRLVNSACVTRPLHATSNFVQSLPVTLFNPAERGKDCLNLWKRETKSVSDILLGGGSSQVTYEIAWALNWISFLELLVYVIAWALGQLRINFTPIFKVFPNFWENFENTSEINPSLPEGTCDYLLIT